MEPAVVPALERSISPAVVLMLLPFAVYRLPPLTVAETPFAPVSAPPRTMLPVVPGAVASVNRLAPIVPLRVRLVPYDTTLRAPVRLELPTVTLLPAGVVTFRLPWLCM